MAVRAVVVYKLDFPSNMMKIEVRLEKVSRETRRLYMRGSCRGTVRFTMMHRVWRMGIQAGCGPTCD